MCSLETMTEVKMQSYSSFHRFGWPWLVATKPSRLHSTHLLYMDGYMNNCPKISRGLDSITPIYQGNCPQPRPCRLSFHQVNTAVVQLLQAKIVTAPCLPHNLTCISHAAWLAFNHNEEAIPHSRWGIFPISPEGLIGIRNELQKIPAWLSWMGPNRQIFS